MRNGAVRGRGWGGLHKPAPLKNMTRAESPMGLLPPESKLCPDRRDRVAVQYLARTIEDNRFLDDDMVGIELLEQIGLRLQLKCVT